MLYLEKNGEYTIWSGEAIDGVLHPINIEQLWSASALAAKNLYKPGVADPIPDGKVSTGIVVKKVGGVVKFAHVLSDAPRPTHTEINEERDHRIATRFAFNGRAYAFDNESKARVIGAATLAGFAVGAGSPVGNYRWHGGDSDFVWIADDDSLNVMDAQTCFAFGQSAANWESQHIFAARAIKDTNPIPYNYKDDVYWP